MDTIALYPIDSIVERNMLEAKLPYLTILQASHKSKIDEKLCLRPNFSPRQIPGISKVLLLENRILYVCATSLNSKSKQIFFQIVLPPLQQPYYIVIHFRTSPFL